MTAAAHSALDAARDDLAFMRALAADRDPLPALYGAHLFAIGACFGPALVLSWAAYAGVAGVSPAWGQLSPLPAAILYIPALIVILARNNRRIRREGRGGPSQRAVWSIWAAVTATIFTLLAGFIAAGARDDLDAAQVMTMWLPAIAALYGGAWVMKAFLRGAPWCALVGVGCFAVSIACAWTANTPTPFLLLGLGLVAFMALPGLAIMLAARRRA